MITPSVETVIIGAGQAGLSLSYHLKQRDREHILLEKADRPGSVWRNDRWDSFTLLTPNWSFRLPGAEYSGPDPHDFMLRNEIVSRFEQYVDRYHLPVQYNQQVISVEPLTDGRGYRLATRTSTLHARNVVVATGLFQRPKIPFFSSNLLPGITQLHSGHYRNPGLLPPGAILVVGSGQSGCQIAEELYQSGRKVYLSVGNAGRAPRRYRGKDIYEWLHLSGFLDRTVDQLPSPQARFAANPHLSGRDGGRDINLHQFAHDGVTLLGRLRGADGDSLWFAPDLKQNLAQADKFAAELVKMVDDFILRSGLDAPLENIPTLREGYAAAEITSLNLAAAGITTIIWAIGYAFDFDLVKLPIFDPQGYPLQKRGVTVYPGLFFLGLPWLYKQKSGLLLGVGEDAGYIASQIAASHSQTR